MGSVESTRRTDVAVIVTPTPRASTHAASAPDTQPALRLFRLHFRSPNPITCHPRFDGLIRPWTSRRASAGTRSQSRAYAAKAGAKRTKCRRKLDAEAECNVALRRHTKLFV